MPRTAWNKRLTPEIEQTIIASYRQGMAASEILRGTPFKTPKTVYDVLDKHCISRRAGLSDYKTYDETVFANLDTPGKAYWLGILITDGYVSDTRRDCEPQIGLQMTDAELLEKFRLFLNTSHPVLRIEPRSEKHLPMYRVVVHSRRMAQDLSRYGVVPRKSALTYLPILDHALMPHLLRGILDGDGTVSQRHDGGTIIGYCGSHRPMAELRMWLICRLGVSDNRLHENGSISFIQWSHEADVKKIVGYLYGEAEVYLARKFALVERYL